MVTYTNIVVCFIIYIILYYIIYKFINNIVMLCYPLLIIMAEYMNKEAPFY